MPLTRTTGSPGSIRGALLALVVLAGFAPANAWALPVTDASSSGTTVVGGSLSGQAESIPHTTHTGSDVDLMFVSDDPVRIQVMGLTFAELSPEEPGIHDPVAETTELEVDLPFIGHASTPIPEPAAAIIFSFGLEIVGHRLNRFPPVKEDEDLL